MTNYTSNIPEARNRLRAIANGLRDCGRIDEADQIEQVITDLMTRKPRRRGPRISNPVTQGIRNEVLRLHRENPDLTNREIAERFNLADGRVTEIIQDAELIPANIRRRT